MDPEKTPRERAKDLITLLLGWLPTPQQGVWVLRLAVVLVVLVAIGRAYDVTLLDWLKLLIVPAVIAGGGIWFNRQQRERELRIAREQREQDARIAESRTQDETLQAYLDQMSDMLIPGEGQPSLYKAQPGDSLSSVARARTLTVLTRLDDERKARVLQFLYESGLIAKWTPVIDIRGADLRGAGLRGGRLSGAVLSGTNLSGADLSGADLSDAVMSQAALNHADLKGANLSSVHLNDADLNHADLKGANLNSADLKGVNLNSAKLNGANLVYAKLTITAHNNTHLNEADLSRADLTLADLSGAELKGANLSGARGRKTRLNYANLRGATLRKANLRYGYLNRADLREAHLNEADLSRADLRRANLSGADLSYADLREAVGLTDEQIAAAHSLEGASMPDGQEYEDCLKNRESRKEDAENGGPS